MKDELANQLYLIDPVFFKEALACINGQMNQMDTCMAFGCECGDGWFKPLEQFVKKVYILNKLGQDCNLRFVCNQLKQKFGTLRVYYSTQKIDPQYEFTKGYVTIQNMFEDALNKCVDDCTHVCQICGASGGYGDSNLIATVGYIRYICKKCARQCTEAQTHHYDQIHTDQQFNKFRGIDRITLFRQQNAFLSLYHKCVFEYNNQTYHSIPHAYFCTVDPDHHRLYDIIDRSSNNDKSGGMIQEVAKQFGFIIDDIDLLRDIVNSKFSYGGNSELRADLLLTRNKLLINMNNKHDNQLGYCYCKDCINVEKRNLYGKILIDIRTQLSKDFTIRFAERQRAQQFCQQLGVRLFKCTLINNPQLLVKYAASNQQLVDSDNWHFEQISLEV